MSESRGFGALRDTNRRFVEHDVDAFHGARHQVHIADVAVDDRHFARRECRFEILAATARQIVQNDDLAESFGDQPVGDVRSDQSCPACHQRSFVVHPFHFLISPTIAAPHYPRSFVRASTRGRARIRSRRVRGHFRVVMRSYARECVQFCARRRRRPQAAPRGRLGWN